MRALPLKAVGLITWATILLVLTGCAQLPVAPEIEARAVKSFTPDPQNGSIYIFRSSAIWGGGVTFPVNFDGQMIGDIGSGTFFNIKVPPGIHDISIRGTDEMDFLNKQLLFSLEVDEAKLYFVRVTVQSARTAKLSVVDEETGKKEVLESQLLNIQVEKGPKMFK